MDAKRRTLNFFEFIGKKEILKLLDFLDFYEFSNTYLKQILIINL